MTRILTCSLNLDCDYLSIEDIGKINKPIVWSLCDMWPISGINIMMIILAKHLESNNF